MDQVTDSVLRTQQRRAAAAAEREARVAAPDPVAELMRQHGEIAMAAKARADMVVPTGRQPITPEPAQSRYQNDYVSLILPDGRGLHASFLLETILSNPKGAALIREILEAQSSAR